MGERPFCALNSEHTTQTLIHCILVSMQEVFLDAYWFPLGFYDVVLLNVSRVRVSQRCHHSAVKVFICRDSMARVRNPH